MNQHLFSYKFDGAQYSITLIADTQAEARARLGAAYKSGVYDGVLVATVPAYLPLSGFAVRAYIWIRNFFKQPPA